LLRLNIYEKWSKSRNVAFISLLEFNPKVKVVDLGCGNGEFTLRAKEKIGCDEIIGVDANEERLNEAKKKGIITLKCNLNDTLPFKGNSFDVIICNQVIEHLYYPVKFMREVYRILKPKGYAVISTENLASWDNIFALLFGYTPFSMEFDSGLYKIGNPLSPYEKEIIKEPFPHVRVFSWKGLIELSKFVGFKIERAVGSGHVLGRIGEIVNQKNARFITIKVRKVE
jgi:SAM-dependent methyltransferase